MKVLDVQWEAEGQTAVPVHIGRAAEKKEAAQPEVRRETKLIVITKDGAILHQCTRRA
jgi:hypothetical protein